MLLIFQEMPREIRHLNVSLSLYCVVWTEGKVILPKQHRLLLIRPALPHLWLVLFVGSILNAWLCHCYTDAPVMSVPSCLLRLTSPETLWLRQPGSVFTSEDTTAHNPLHQLHCWMLVFSKKLQEKHKAINTWQPLNIQLGNIYVSVTLKEIFMALVSQREGPRRDLLLSACSWLSSCVTTPVCPGCPAVQAGGGIVTGCCIVLHFYNPLATFYTCLRRGRPILILLWTESRQSSSKK